MASSFDHLIYPLERQSFHDGYFDRTSLHISSRGDHYATLFSTNALEALLWEHELHLESFVRVHNAGCDKAPPIQAQRLNLHRWILEEYRNGSTIIVNNLDLFSVAIATYLRGLETEFNSRATATAYLTPPRAQGFVPHFDTHDVFIAQMEGSKEYSLFEQDILIEHPLIRHQRLVSLADLSGSEERVVLREGDLLYIPRGLVHFARTQEEHSLHLSIGVHSPKVVDAIKALVDTAADVCPRLRAAYHRQSGNAETDLLLKLQEVLNEHLDTQLSSNDLAAALMKTFVSGLRALPSGTLLTADDLNIGMRDLVQKRIGAVCHVTIVENHVSFSFSGLDVVRDELKVLPAIQAPEATFNVLEYVATSSGLFCAADLPGSLSDSAKLSIVRKLMVEGLLCRAYPARGLTAAITNL
jgi:cupin superfamily protein